MHINLQMIVLFGMTAVSCAFGFSIFRGKFRGPGSKTVGLMMFFGAIWMSAFALEIGSSSFGAKLFWDFMEYIACLVLPVAWLIFILQFSGREHLITRRSILLLSVIPSIFLIVILTNSSHGLMWNDVRFDPYSVYLELVKSFGPLYWAFEAFEFAYIFIGVYFVIQMIVRSSRVYLYQATAVLLASFIPPIGIILGALKLFSFTRYNIGAIATGISIWIVGWNIVRFRLVDTMRLARQTVLERMNHGVIVLYAENEVVYLNEVAANWIGHSRGEVIGAKIEDYWQQWPGGCELATDHEEIVKEITVGIGEEERNYETRISPLLDWRGRLVGQVVLIQDITERIRSEKALRRYADELKRSNQELERFAYIASHDLQEPLRTIAGYTQLLSRRYKGRLDQDADDFIDFAVDGAVRMQQLINDLLEYSRVGTHGKTFELTDTAQLIESVLGAMRAVIEESNARITYNGMPTVEADATQLRQLFQNLIGNAIKFRSGRPLEIKILTNREEGEWHFVVLDNGIGIEEAYYDRIFQIFQRLHSREEYPGTGIGLAVCKRIVERHGGKIWVESKMGVGSAFHFTIPEKGKVLE
jgi:PAS domain S-box-containing protein